MTVTTRTWSCPTRTSRWTIECGWRGGTGECRHAAVGEDLAVFQRCRRHGCCWGCGTFAAAVEVEHVDVLEWLIEAGCSDDSMGWKAFDVAVALGRPEVVDCCSGFCKSSEEQSMMEILTTGTLQTAAEARDMQMVKALMSFIDGNWRVLDTLCSVAAEKGDLEMPAWIRAHVLNVIPYFVF